MSDKPFDILLINPNLVIFYLSNRHDDILCSTLWSKLLSADEDLAGIRALLGPILDAARMDRLPHNLKPDGKGLSAAVDIALGCVLQDCSSSIDVSFLNDVLRRPGERLLRYLVNLVHIDIQYRLFYTV